MQFCVMSVLELCCFEWFQNPIYLQVVVAPGFRAVLFRMVPKPCNKYKSHIFSFRAVLFRMVPKLVLNLKSLKLSFRAVLFRMVPKPEKAEKLANVLF